MSDYRKKSSGKKKKTTAKRSSKKKKTNRENDGFPWKSEVLLFVILAFAVLLFLSNFGLAGTLGAKLSAGFFAAFGAMNYIVPFWLFLFIAFLVSNYRQKGAIQKARLALKSVAAVLLLVFLCVFTHMTYFGAQSLELSRIRSLCVQSHRGGGLVGGMIGRGLTGAVGLLAGFVIDIIVLILAVVLISERSFFKSVSDHGKQAAGHMKESGQNRRRKHHEEKRMRSEANEDLPFDPTPETADTEAKRQAMREAQQSLSGEYAASEYPPKKKRESTASQDIRPVTITLTEDPSREASQTLLKESAINPSMELTEVSAQDYIHENEERLSASSVTRIGEDEAQRSQKIKEYTSNLTDNYISQDAETGEPTAHLTKNSSESTAGSSSAAKKKTAATAAAAAAAATATAAASSRRSKSASAASAVSASASDYRFPSVSLLSSGKGVGSGDTREHLQKMSDKLQLTLTNFGVDARVTNVTCGPSVTRYEIQPAMGVKVSKILGLADDIKLNLAVADIRIEAPVPGKSVIGIEVPNKKNSPVIFRQLIESAEFRPQSSRLAFCVGKDIAGKNIIADIAKMPHVLIAGATGSGKSVCINTIIMSVLFHARPDEVKMIMIDPKVVELSVYNGIPHLLLPVVTDPKKAAGALNWAVAEMSDRYQKFAAFHVRDMQAYNKKIDSMPDTDEDKPERMPQILIVVDELADLMMVAANDVEAAICRLAQLARAAGLHLVLATQRPSVNVITGLIKANMPSRIAFSVTSGVDSRTILDMNGAEKLLGKGDMLFSPQDYQKPLRVQGAFVSDREVADVVADILEKNGDMPYDESIDSKVEQAQSVSSGYRSSGSGPDRDMYFEDAGRFVIEKEKGSIGMLQRMFKIGFNRAARIMDQLEEAGVVGPEEGTKARQVLMNAEEFEAYIQSQDIE